MLASFAPAAPSIPYPIAARFLPDSLLEPVSVPAALPPMPEFRPLGALSLDELAAIAGCAVLSAGELAERGMTADDYHCALREQALAVQVTRYADRTRLFLGIRADIAFTLNDTAAAAIGAIMARQGCPPPETTIFTPSPDERAEIILLNPTCDVVAKISFDLRGAGTMDEVRIWLERTLAGDRLFDLGISRLKNPEEYGEVAERVLSRLWDSFAPA